LTPAQKAAITRDELRRGAKAKRRAPAKPRKQHWIKLAKLRAELERAIRWREEMADNLKWCQEQLAESDAIIAQCNAQIAELSAGESKTQKHD